MPLEPVSTEPGLWTNKDCPPDGPGVHALIIGVSRYDHLGGSSAPAPQTHGLGQLSVSALTAYSFFSWLRKGYTLDGWPVARVRLLMSPLRKGDGNSTTDELEGRDAVIRAHTPEATYDNCKHALEQWYADMEALKAPATGRSLFLFSGHGMERRQNYQVLLPSNYLRPPIRPEGEAISTRNIADALSYLACVSSHVLLLDGCRNDIDALRSVEGTRILNDDQRTPINPLFEKAALYATASGLRAYSPRSGGLSLFGQALIDGLSNKPEPALDETPLELVRKGDVAKIEVNKLASYMKRRVDALIRAAKESVVQVVRSEVASSDPDRPIELAEIDMTSELEVLGGGTIKRFSLDATRRSRRRGAFNQPAPDPDAWFRERYQPEQRAVVAPPTADRKEHLDRFHAIFGSEAITYPWLDKLRITELSTGQSFDHKAVDIFSFAQAVKTPELHRLQLHFRIKRNDPIAHLLTIDDGQRRFCCILPSELERPVFQLEIDVEQGSYINFATYLSPRNSGTTGAIASAWEQLRARDPTSAARLLEANDTVETLMRAYETSEEAFRREPLSPLAATVGNLLLLKGNQLDRMHDRARNLANWVRSIPDNVGLWTEQRRRMTGGKPLDAELVPWFVRESSRRALPFTSDGFGLACDIVGDIHRGRLQTDAATHAAARGLADRLNAAMPYFRDTGLFCTFAGFPADWDPVPILGPPSS